MKIGSIKGGEVGMNELKPCPFCSKTESVRIKIYPFDGRTREADTYSVVCDHIHGGCGSESGHYYSPDSAVKYWNMRSKPKNNEIKEQSNDEASKVICKILFDIPYYFCGDCKTMLDMYSAKAKYCSQCGKAVKWE